MPVTAAAQHVQKIVTCERAHRAAENGLLLTAHTSERIT
jgi:hypothetical protein